MYSYVEYLFKSILEAVQAGDDLPVYFSDSLRDIFKEIEQETHNEVATRLLFEEGKKGKRVFIDIDQDSIDKISFLMSNKVKDNLGRTDNLRYLSPTDYDKVWKARQRGTMKINRFINDIFNNEYQTKQLTPEDRQRNKEKGIKTSAQHLEDFVNQFKAIREPGKFELVKGGEIPYWYLGERSETGNGSLGGSCMNSDECQEYLEFYEYNQHKISMLIMKSKKNEKEIIGRALVWKLDSPSGRTFMDRVYTNNDHDVENFKKYAKDNGWLYKFKQNMDAHELVVDTVNDKTEHVPLIIKDINEGPTDSYNGSPIFPYLDTMKFYSIGYEIISNQIDELPSDGKIYKLEGTEGTDYYTINNRSIEELREMHKEDILNDIKYYAVEIYPNMFWDYIDNRYVQSFIDGEVNYYSEDFEYIWEGSEKDLIKYIKSNADENDIPENIDEMDLSELLNLVEELNIKGEISREYAEERYANYSPEEIFDELYGLSNGINNDIFDQLKYYFDEDKFAEDASEIENEDDLRERYPYDED